MITEQPHLRSASARHGAVVLGGNFLGLGLVRSLGSRGIPVWVIDRDHSKSIAQFSRYTKRFIESREPIADLLLRLGREHYLNRWVLFPSSDEYVEALAVNHSSLSSIYQLITPPFEITRFALDKRLTYRRAEDLKINVPWTSFGTRLEDLDIERLPYPLILKPGINHHFFPQTNVKALPANNASELRRRYGQVCQYIPPDEILIQERIPGNGDCQFSFCALCLDGKILGSLVARRKRQYPIDFGNASTFVETVVQPDVEAAGRRFLTGIGFDGIAEIEFKYDARDRKYKILDVNPRPWGWHTLGKAAGIDFPYLVWRLKAGLDLLPIPPYRSASWCREITDVLAIAKGPNAAAEALRLLAAMLNRRFTLATFSFADPIPFFAELAWLITSGLSRQKTAKRMLQFDGAK